MIRCLLAAATLLMTQTALAAQIEVLSHGLFGDTADQPVQIFVSGGETIRGVNVRAQLGDGTGPIEEPVFFSIDPTGSVFAGLPFTVLGGVVNGAPQFVQTSIVLNTPGAEVPADGLLFTLRIDTTAIVNGEFDLRLSTTQIGLDSDLIVTGGGTLPIQIINGSVSIVPEPAATALIISLAMLGRKRRRT